MAGQGPVGRPARDADAESVASGAVAGDAVTGSPDAGAGAGDADTVAADMGALQIPAALVGALRCPGRPGLRLTREGGFLVAVGAAEAEAEAEAEGAEGAEGGATLRFPVVGGTPVLIDEARSIFRHADFTDRSGVTTMDLRADAVRLDTPLKRAKNAVQAMVPTKSRSVTDFGSAAALADVAATVPDAKILVIGAGDSRFVLGGEGGGSGGSEGGGDGGGGAGGDSGSGRTGPCIVYTDVALAPDTHMIADAHDIPFADGTFDAVFSIAVLEHVADPWRCADEIRRVLKPGGRVYAVTPFMQQVHMGRYDFTRFTAVGHRRLFRWFDELRAGAANGPGMAVAWSIEYLFSSMAEGRRARSLLRIAGRFVGWPFLLLDGWVARKRGVYDCASAYYFYGRLRDAPLGDREILDSYRGLN